MSALPIYNMCISVTIQQGGGGMGGRQAYVLM